MSRPIVSIAALALGACLLFGADARGEGSSLEEGIVQYRAENFEEAVELLEKSRAEQPQSSVAAFYLGLARKQGGDLAGAVKDLTDAANLKPPVLDSYLELADAHHTLGEDRKALKWVKRSEQAGVNPARTAFLKGIILAAQGKREPAIKSLQQAKQLDPTLAQSADFQMAIVMASSRRLTRARDALRAVVAADPTSEMASYAKEYEDSFTRVIESYRPLRLAVALNYLYDDNAISNPSDADARVMIGNPTGQEDHALLGSLRLDYNPMLDGDALFSAQYLLQSTKYSDGDNPSTIINSLTLMPGYSFGDSALALPINYSHVLLKEEKYQHLLTARPTWSWQVAPQHITQGSLLYTRRDMLKKLDRDEDRDANIYGLSAGHIYSYGSQGGMAALRYDLNYDAAEGDNWRNRSQRFSLNGVVPVASKVKVNLAGEVTLQDYTKTHTVFGVERDDTIWLGTAGLSWHVTPNTIISAQYAHTSARSNIAVYDYNRNTFTTGVEFGF